MKILESVLYTTIVLILSISIFLYMQQWNYIIINLYKQKNTIENFVSLNYYINYLINLCKDYRYCYIKQKILNPFKGNLLETNNSCIKFNTLQFSYSYCYSNTTIINKVFRIENEITLIFIKNNSFYKIIFK